MINRIQDVGVNELLFTEGRDKYQQQDFGKLATRLVKITEWLDAPIKSHLASLCIGNSLEDHRYFSFIGALYLFEASNN